MVVSRLTASTPGSLVARDEAVFAQAAAYASTASAAATRKGYGSDWIHFAAWCQGQGLAALPAAPVTVGGYLAAMAPTLKVSTLSRRLAALAIAHRLAGHQLDLKHPGIAAVMIGIRRQHGSAQRQAAPATVDVVKAMVATCGEDLAGLRDRALLLLGFAGAFRRAELVALQVEDVTEDAAAGGLRVTLRRSKGDQAGEGQVVGIARTGSATCPVAALALWRGTAGIETGRLLRSVDRHGRVGDGLSDKAVALVVKRRAEAAGLDPALFSGHSLRAGLATSAAAHGLEERDIQRQTRHRSVAVLRRYIRDGALFRANVSGKIGL